MRRRKIELLSPAKNAETARQAILCGADAVYIGADKFGARREAANSVEEIAELCDFAHLYGCRVYVALNTILFDSEIPQASELAQRLYRANVDALILQDLGLIECGLPPIAIHASTQCHTATPEKARFLERCGFSAVVAARELSVGEIAAIRRALKPETRIECFVHGALCVSYSGRCRLSYAIGGRSGNRGECAQPCRMKYALIDGEGREIRPSAYYLSLRDMNRLENLGAMIDAGADIFKIEGRLKDAGYVKNITALYRRKLDALLAERGLEKSSYGEIKIGFEPSAEKSFNRGFCAYHIDGTQGGCASFATPKARGEFLGRVRRVSGAAFALDGADKTLSNGDGLLFESDGETFGAAVYKTDGERIFAGRPESPAVPKIGAKVFRNKDTAFEAALERKAERRMAVKISVSERGGNVVFSAETLDDRRAAAQVEIQNAESATNPEAAKAALERNLSKLGDTPFCAAEIDVRCTPFLRVSEINAVRRSLCAALEKSILEAYNAGLKARKIPQPDFGETPAEPLSAEDNVSNAYAENFYEKFGAKTERYACEATRADMRGARVMTTKHCVLRELGLCKKTSGKKIEEPIRLKNESATLRLKFDCARCGMEIFFE